MLHAKRSLWFFLAALFLLIYMFIPAARITLGGETVANYHILEDGLLVALDIVTIAVCLIGIFLYGHRKGQYAMGFLGLALTLILFIFSMLEVKEVDDAMFSINGGITIGTFFPFFVAIFLSLAIYEIRMDVRTEGGDNVHLKA